MFTTVMTPTDSHGRVGTELKSRELTEIGTLRPRWHGRRRLAAGTGLVLLVAGLFPGTPSARAASNPFAGAAAGEPAATIGAAQGPQAVQQLQQQGLYDSLREAVTAARYQLRPEQEPAGNAPLAYYAPNASQKLHAQFKPDGLHLAPQAVTQDEASQPEWKTTMTLVGYGYGTHLLRLGAASLVARGNRVEYRRPGLALTEWYVNEATGVEQGFTLDAPPAARSEGERLRLALEVAGGLSVELIEDGQAVALKRADGELALRYGGLYSYDAQGRALPSHMSVRGRQVILEVDDDQAVYPVTIDPVFTQQAKLFASDGVAGDYFGYSVAVYWNTAVVGAPFDDVNGNANQGSAYVFVRSDGYWSQQAILTANGGEAEDWFGTSVAISGDTVVVGSPEYYQTSTAGPGSAYVFVRSGTAWSQQTRLTPSDGVVHDYFGRSVAIAGNTVVVGAPYAEVDGNSLHGSAYVFVRSGTAWSQQVKLVANDGAEANFFGYSVAIGGSTVAVGAHYASVDGNTSQGSAYVFVRSFGAWRQQAKLTADDGAAKDYFGQSVSISGTGSRVVVGAPTDDVGANANQGSAYVFARSYGVWNQEAQLTASDGAAHDRFGFSVAINGYEVVVGAPYDDIFGIADQGSAYVFVCNGTCGAAEKLVAASGAAGDNFGSSVAIVSGTTSTLVVGSMRDDSGASADRGSTYVLVR